MYMHAVSRLTSSLQKDSKGLGTVLPLLSAISAGVFEYFIRISGHIFVDCSMHVHVMLNFGLLTTIAVRTTPALSLSTKSRHSAVWCRDKKLPIKKYSIYGNNNNNNNNKKKQKKR